MNCLYSCFKNLVFRGRQLVASTPAEDHGMERDWGMEPSWFWDCVQAVIYGENRDDINYYFGM